MVVAPLRVVVPVTPNVPPTVALPFDANVLNVPDAGVVPPIAILFIVPPVNVAPDEEKLFAVVGPFKETAPVPVLNVPDPDCKKFPVAVRLVNFPVEAVVTPMATLSMDPPVRVAPDEEKLFAVVAPLRVVAPVTPSVPPKVVAPVPTENVFDPVTLVGPFRETAPVPVEKVVAPLCAKLVAKFKLFPLVSKVTNAEPPALVNLNALAESDCGVNVALGALP
jgi:hypothetical protein